MKNILENKKTKRLVAIGGVIVIILATAGIFAYQASTIKVEQLPEKSELTGAPGTPKENIEHFEFTGSIPGAVNNNVKHTFPVNESAKKARIVATSTNNKDIDLYVYDPNGKLVGKSATSETTETVELKESDLKVTGEWTAEVGWWLGQAVRQGIYSDAEYKLTIDIWYK